LQIYNSLKSKKIMLSYNYIYIGVLIFILFFGGFTFTHFGRFEFTSTNGPVNLLIGANDNATGGFKSAVFEKGKIGYIKNSDTLTYIQKGDYYKAKAIEWIEDHPLDWVFLMPLKLLHAFGWDDITLSTFLGFNELNFGRALRNLFDGNINSSTSVQKSVFSYFFYFLIQFLHHLFYYIILISILIGIYILIKHKVCNDGINVILLFSFNLIIIILIIFGSPRFKYPIFILLLPFAASYLDLKLGIGNNRIEK